MAQIHWLGIMDRPRPGVNSNVYRFCGVLRLYRLTLILRNVVFAVLGNLGSRYGRIEIPYNFDFRRFPDPKQSLAEVSVFAE